MRWITREHPKIDRVACPWLITKFIDPEAEFLLAPTASVLARAAELHAIPYDIEGVELSHDGSLCSFDAFLQKYALTDHPVLQELAVIVRGADTDRLDIAPQAAGLLAISLGLSQLFPDDHDLITRGFLIYDALYAWLQHAKGERHSWNPQRVPAPSPPA